ncbi:hypothetical protein [Vibrio barjaei]|uniref:hypothetical protein n=1 Tax=Vibrio barjaei TaxID=1676683 RepID=UPI002283DBE1|nr:hypothetical protein [Vibrio barjaei]MCY9874616.1 hypothetical protein [Vibrio barjaei]
MSSYVTAYETLTSIAEAGVHLENVNKTVHSVKDWYEEDETSIEEEWSKIIDQANLYSLLSVEDILDGIDPEDAYQVAIDKIEEGSEAFLHYWKRFNSTQRQELLEYNETLDAETEHAVLKTIFNNLAQDEQTAGYRQAIDDNL